MKKILIATFVGILCVGFGLPVQAKRRANHSRDEAPRSQGIAKAMDDIRWGTSIRELLSHFEKEIRSSYQEKLAKATDAIEQDSLRQRMTEELRRLREGYVEFKGETAGWDVSFLRDEYTHNNNESMLVVRDDNSQNFYFFIQGRLWKWYKAFDAGVFAGQPFPAFAGALQGRFGHASERTGKLHADGDEKHWLEWQDATTRLRAVDQTEFYGFYCLVFEENTTLSNLDRLRSTRKPKGESRHAMVDAVVNGEEVAEPDSNPDIADHITGQIRNRNQNRGKPSSADKRGTQRGASANRGNGTTQTADNLDGLDSY